MLTAYKYRIYLNNEQKIAFAKHFGCARHVYNWGLTLKQHHDESTGKNVIKIHRFSPSSKLCHVCGYRLDSLPLSVREWACPSCCYMHDRDVNAAKNKPMIGLADSLGLSDCVKSSSVATLVGASTSAEA